MTNDQITMTNGVLPHERVLITDYRPLTTALVIGACSLVIQQSCHTSSDGESTIAAVGSGSGLPLTILSYPAPISI